jgi:hypothetical protein
MRACNYHFRWVRQYSFLPAPLRAVRGVGQHADVVSGVSTASVQHLKAMSTVLCCSSLLHNPVILEPGVYQPASSSYGIRQGCLGLFNEIVSTDRHNFQDDFFQALHS